MSFPLLYQKDSKNNIKEWKIKVVENKILIEYGLINGKKRNLVSSINSGKNIGKKNETSKDEQAIKEAMTKWNNKKNNGYTEIKPDINVNLIVHDQIRPMLALDYSKRFNDIVEPFYVQPKLDGVRALFMNGRFYSRINKEYEGLEHIKNEIGDRIKKNIPILDGELYSDTLTFQELISRIKNPKLCQLEVKYNVYDIVKDEPFKDRYKWILNNLYNFSTVNIVETHIINRKDEINNMHDKYVKDGYEGIMIRNMDGLYKKDYRCKDLQKFKKFKEDEYEIIGFREGQNTEKGCVVWICKTEEEKEFSVRPEGTQNMRKEYFKNGEKSIGKKLTVKYQELTDNNIPRFPVGKSIRDFE